MWPISPQLKQAFADGLDIHAMTASEMFGVPIEGMDPMVRRRAKAINFGIIYGISAFGLANQLGIERGEAGDYIKTYFERFPGIKDYMEATKASMRAWLCRDDLRPPRALSGDQHQEPEHARLQRARGDQRADPGLGRRHHPPRHGAHGRAAARPRSSTRKCCLQVHDELIFEVPEDQVDATIEAHARRHGKRRRCRR
jgi:DNA polymerase-1